MANDKLITLGNLRRFKEDADKAYLNHTPITYSQLVALRSNNEFVVGCWYRITDYVATTSQSFTESKNHPFDILVLAISPNQLSEEALAVRHDGDTYFANCNLSAWKVWYCLTNDDSRFAWANTNNGKGVIYRLIDEYGNDLPYDFKGIGFVESKFLVVKCSVGGSSGFSLYFRDSEFDNGSYRAYISIYRATPTSEESMAVYVDTDTPTMSTTIRDSNGTALLGYSIRKVKTFLPFALTYNSSTKTELSVNPKSAFNIKIGPSFNDRYRIPMICMDATATGTGALSNIVFGNDCDAIFLKSDSDGAMHNAHFGNNAINNCFSAMRKNINSTFGDMFWGNLIDGDVTDSKIGANFIGNEFFYIENCEFGNDFQNNVFYLGCENNSFGNNCRDNIFNHKVEKSTFGNFVQSNQLSVINACRFGDSFVGNISTNHMSACIFGQNNQYLNIVTDTNPMNAIRTASWIMGSSTSNRKTITVVGDVDYEQWFVRTGSTKTEV